MIRNGGSHFIARQFESLLKNYGLKYGVSSPYQPQTSGQAEISNRETTVILEKTISISRKDWFSKLDDTLRHTELLSKLLLV